VNDAPRDAVGFDKQHWPDLADGNWEQRIHACYGTQPSRLLEPT